MAGVVRPNVRPSYEEYKIVTGANADSVVHARAGGVAKVHVITAGAALSTVRVYDGTVASGVLVSHIIGTAIGTEDEMNIWLKTSIDVATVDSGGNLRVRISGFMR